MITEEMMAAAAAEMNEAMLRSLPEPEDCYHEFSAKFEKKMKRVMYRADHPLQFRILQKVASIILVLFLGFATIMAISPTVRASVFGWIREQYESLIHYYFNDSVSSVEGPTTYYISNLPPQYTELTSFFNEELGEYTGVYSDDEGNVLYFMYSLIPEITNYYLGSEEDYIVEHVYISTNRADFYQSKDHSQSNGIIWCDSETNTVFYLSARLNKEEIIALAEGIKSK